jgi:hypothetical protein
MWSDRPAVGSRLETIRGDPAFGPTYYTGSQLAENLRAQFGG